MEKHQCAVVFINSKYWKLIRFAQLNSHKNRFFFCGIFDSFLLSSGGAELLFNGVKDHHVTLPSQSEPCEYHLSVHAIENRCIAVTFSTTRPVFPLYSSYCSFKPVSNICVVQLLFDDNIN